MSRSKPFALWPFFKAGEALGRERLSELLRRIYLQGWTWTPAGAPLLSAYARVHAHSAGKPPSPEERRRFLERLAAVYADSEATKFALHVTPPERRLAGVELAALPAIERLRAGGRGVILASPHFGNLPLTMIALAAKVPLTVVFVNAKPWMFIEEHGPRVLGLGTAAREILRALANNECVLLLSDLDFYPNGRAVPFFGAPIRPPQGLCRIAETTQAPILPLYAVGDSAKLRVEADAPIMPAGRTAQELEEPLLRSMERRIAKHPDHWLVLRDIWDLERSDTMNRRQLELIELYDSIVDG